MIRIGCSGWNYRHWRGDFYPEGVPVKRWFAHYAQAFDTVEINASFYRRPTAETFAKWREQAPEGFCYAVKAPRFITHMRKLKECEESIAEFLARARHLRPALGPILYQLPPNWRFDRERLESFLALLPRDLTHVFEFREPSWLADEVLAILDAAGVGFCAHDFPGLATQRAATGNTAYVRFHGTSGKYWGRYSKEALRDWADWMRGQEAEGRAVWAYFNNDIHAHAIADATALKVQIGRDAASPS
ncbi:hypothetical protein SCH01S_23_00100 [Sphingomonas changbaiensis NBRC 104936]|uniref:DUF72 domain-containing protein n=2 Tax=Sphingomonas changbaiensis TaxID=529705 RepID=A0A0E9MPD3_9SPHN|nr:hypothetical protein SCH01S_23_00100 [Sphingomonas changbaiensis NBRC 104936]